MKMGCDKDVLIQIEEIRHQLWLGHASLMVGCGFSLNADKSSPHIPLPPDWNKLCLSLAKKLYSTYGEDVIAQMAKNKSALQLAHEFDIKFQRPALNLLLKDLIQDENLLPSRLHTKLLELPWSDVFTTNYDSLLERASEFIIDKKYDVVYNYRDLTYSEAPRIIKLHGSFPTEATHLIVSEEDYRKYPHDFNPFVNTVQQAIMESALCLIGFSGTDPNFQKWIGWVKDNLKDSMPPIFLIGLLELPDPERQVLVKKNIIPVDLSELDGVNKRDHKTGFTKFFELLEKKPGYIDWQPGFESCTFSPREAITEEVGRKTIEAWTIERISYPNWIVMPWAKRANLVYTTQNWTNSIDWLNTLSSPWDIKGLFELNWRLEKCLMPIWNNLIPCYESILKKYNPFSLDLDFCKDGEITLEIKLEWEALLFALLRWCREEAEATRWNEYVTILEQVVSDNSDSQNHLFHEKAMYAMSVPDLPNLDAIIVNWSKIPKTPEWNVKYASIISELGQTEKAVDIYRAALNELRPYIPKSRIKNDFFF